MQPANTEPAPGERPGRYIGGGHLDRRMLSDLLDEMGCAALVLWSERAIRHACGADPGNAVRFERPGAAFLIVPRDPDSAPAAIVGDYYAADFAARSGIPDTRAIPIWVGTADVSGHAGLVALMEPAADRPETFDAADGLAALAKAIHDLGLSGAPLAYERLGELAVAFTPARIPVAETARPACDALRRLRVHKSLQERGLLRDAAQCAQAGVEAALDQVRQGMHRRDLLAAYAQAALAKARRTRPAVRAEPYGVIGFGPSARADDRRLAKGDIIRIDVGMKLDGYASDSARSFAFGRAPAEAADVHAALLSAFEATVEAMDPGVPLSKLHSTGVGAMHRAGYHGYRRGHLGHGLGASSFTEEWPFISAKATHRLAPSNVMAVELPWYVTGMGALIVEDQFEWRDGRFRPVWTLPRRLVEV